MTQAPWRFIASSCAHRRGHDRLTPIGRCRDPTLQKAEEIRTRRQLCFVMTDLEGSTAMASKNQNVFVNIQEVHDVVRLPRQEPLCLCGAATSLSNRLHCACAALLLEDFYVAGRISCYLSGNQSPAD